MGVKAINNFSTVLAAALIPAATQITLAAGKGNELRLKLTGSTGTAFGIAAGTTDYLYLTLYDAVGTLEIIKVTSIPATGDICTVIVRGQDGTTSRYTDWPINSTIAARPCAAFFTDALLLLGTTATAVSYAGCANISAGTTEAAIDSVGGLIAAINATLATHGTVVTKSTGTTSGTVPLIGTSSATTALAGLVELADSGETVTGTDTTRATTPAGVAAAIAAINKNLKSQIYPSGSGNWTVPAGVTSAFAVVVGGGGGGADYTATSGGDGGSGGVACGVITGLTPGATHAYVVGAGGNGNNAGGNGSNGGPSSLGTLLTASGGAGGQVSDVNGADGTGTGGTTGNMNSGNGVPLFPGAASTRNGATAAAWSPTGDFVPGAAGNGETASLALGSGIGGVVAIFYVGA